MCDINDEMIDVHCSFMVGLVNELCNMQAKENIKIVVLDTHQYNSLSSKYSDLYGTGGSNTDKIRILKQDEFSTTFHTLHGSNNLQSKTTETIILAITADWQMSDVLQALTLGRTRIIIAETSENAGKHLSEKSESAETIRINDLIYSEKKG